MFHHKKKNQEAAIAAEGSEDAIVVESPGDASAAEGVENSQAPAKPEKNKKEKKPKGEPLPKGVMAIAAVYLLGLFIGALDTGIITPARTVIQTSFGVDDAFGVWLITIYTLAYAVSIPIMGKFADMYGRKGMYLISVILFGVGSLMCGVASMFDNFYFLLIARAIQAFGGGGIVPIATAEMGTVFPPDKRGMALGMVGGVYGVANIFGASAGSLILDIFGQQNWPFIFYVNVPICIAIILVGLKVIPKTTERANNTSIDILGILILSCMSLSLLIGLKNIDFFDLGNSIRQADVYPYLIISLMLLPFFIFAEHRAKNPVMNLNYFKNVNILITLILSILTGVIMMGMVFVPQFAENALKLPSGSGGYSVIILGLFAGVGSPMSGKLIDKFGVKLVLGIGFVGSLAGCLYLAFVAVAHPSTINLVISLILIGFGMGFVMGTPLNYMMLENTDEAESNSALATLSLVRSIGTAVAPAIMVGFIVHATATLPEQITEVLPKQVTVSALPHAQELTEKVEKYKADEDTAEMMADMEMPDLLDMQTIDVKMDMSGDSDYEISDELLEEMQSSDVTTIVQTTKHMTTEMFGEMKPELITDIEEGINEGISGIATAIDDMQSGLDEMNDGANEMSSGINEMNSVINKMNNGISQQRAARTQMAEMLPTLQQMEEYMSGAGGAGADGTNTSNMGSYNSVLDLMPEDVKANMPQSVLDMLADVKTSADLQAKINELDTAIAEMTSARNEMISARDEMINGRAELETAIADMDASKAELATMQSQMEEMKAAIPSLFDEAEANYLVLIDESAEDIETVFQSCLNEGFKGMFLLVAVCSVAGLVFMVFYRGKKQSSDARTPGKS